VHLFAQYGAKPEIKDHNCTMKPQFEKIELAHSRSLQFLHLRLPAFDAPWHFHPQGELTFIRSGRGRRFVGSSMEPFQAGDLVLLGPHLPHFWHSDPPPPETPMPHAEALVVHFSNQLLDAHWREIPELRKAQRLLQKASQGLVFSGKPARHAVERLFPLVDASPLDCWNAFWELLDTLGALPTSHVRSLGQELPPPDEGSRLGKAYAFLLAHFSEPIALGDVAAAAAMSPAAFSRFFKRAAGRNLWEFLTELRLDNACRLLRESEQSVTEIALNSGFPTLSSFHRHFRARFRTAPRAYRSAFS
jgi:AraC-like DNA-binding protein